MTVGFDILNGNTENGQNKFGPTYLTCNAYYDKITQIFSCYSPAVHDSFEALKTYILEEHWHLPS